MILRDLPQGDRLGLGLWDGVRGLLASVLRGPEVAIRLRSQRGRANRLVQVLQIFRRRAVGRLPELRLQGGDLIDEGAARAAPDDVGLDDGALLGRELSVPVGEQVLVRWMDGAVAHHRRNLAALSFSTSSSRASRARASRDITVPTGRSSTSAISE